MAEVEKELYKVRPFNICVKCKHFGGLYDRENNICYFWCSKYSDCCERCKRKCKKLKKGLLKLIKESVNG